MQKKQATGVDTWAMLPVYGSIFVIICTIFLPWISIPVLKYSKLPTTYTFWNFDECIQNVQRSIQEGGKLKMNTFTGQELEILQTIGQILKIAAVLLIVAMLICGIVSYKMKKKGVVYVKILFFIAALYPVFVFLLIGAGNLFINERMGRTSDFINLTIHSYIQMTSWQYGQLIISALLFIFARKFLDTQAEKKQQMYIERSMKKDRRIGKRTLVSLLLILAAIPFVIFFGIFFLNDRSDIFISMCIIGLSMIPFCMVFEGRNPQAREILLIAVMAAIAVVGRMAFFMLPQFKPVTAIVIIAGVGLGAEAGFLTGAMAGFVSNFFFGQGPWTPWQMFSFGIIGFLAGVIFSKSKNRKGSREAEWLHVLTLCIFGGLATLVIYGLLMDTSTVFMSSQELTWQAFLAVYISGFPFNVIHAVSTVIFLFFLALPMERKLDRIKKKYGILEV